MQNCKKNKAYQKYVNMHVIDYNNAFDYLVMQNIF